MDEAILLPSPNWFQVSGLGVSKDGWLVYGGPSKSLCVLEPLSKEHKTVFKENRYHVHVFNRVHGEKIVSVDISPEWPLKQCILTGSADGSVKQWTLERVGKSIKIKLTHSHEIHNHEKEEVAGVGYSNEVYAITVGCFGNLVKWDLNSNVTKTYNNFLKNFKPVCMSCSHHLPLNVAIGTKQGVIFVLDLNGDGKMVYKVRGQDEEILCVSWCPQYEVAVMKALMESEQRTNVKKTDKKERSDNTKTEVIEPLKNVSDDIEKKESDNSDFLDKSKGKKKKSKKKNDSTKVDSLADKLCNIPVEEKDLESKAEESQESEVQEDDLFDIYKDHESDEFGHKKYEPEVIKVKVTIENETENDYLTECNMLKEKILMQKKQSEISVEELVDALDKTHVDDQQNDGGEKDKIVKDQGVECSVHVHKHLLATVGKYGGVRIWSKTGKLVSHCAVSPIIKNKSKTQMRTLFAWATVLWYAPDTLLVADSKSQLLRINPLKIDCKNKLDWKVVHNIHKRGLFCIASDAPRVQNNQEHLDKSAENWKVWTVSQDRNLVCYNVKKNSVVVTYNTLGGFPYTVQPCPYDAKKLAVAVGDGAVRVWRCETDDDDKQLTGASVTTYWQNVQGKVLTVAWHPTKENLLAFGTAEARVGVIDGGGKIERAARVLHNALRGGVYSLYWDEGLLACGGGDLIIYDVGNSNEGPRTVEVVVEGQRWDVSTARRCPRGLLCGSGGGAVALLAHAPPHAPLAAAYVYSKMIHCIDWHPERTSLSTEESQYKNLIAVCSLDKSNNIVILEYIEQEANIKLQIWKTLTGHRAPVLQVAWNPHRDAQLLSTSQDVTVRIWNAADGVCLSIFGNHVQSAFGATWLAFPQFATKVVSGGADSCLRIWDIEDHPAADYDESKHEILTKRARKNKEKAEKKKDEKPQTQKVANTEEHVAASLDTKIKASKKFLLPCLSKQLSPCSVNGLKKMFKMFVDKKSGISNGTTSDDEENCFDTDYIKMFGSISEVNELLDKELKRHLDVANYEAYTMLCIFRGQIDTMIQFASQKDFLDPYLLSIAPSVSLKYWKDATQLYVAQIDRMIAKGEEDKLREGRQYGGASLRRCGSLLAAHDVRGALAALAAGRLYKEAYLLCRVRYMDSIAQDVLEKWAEFSMSTGLWNLAAVCFIALENITQAAIILGKSNDRDCLSLAVEMAKYTGQYTFAEHLEEKLKELEYKICVETSDELDELPARADLVVQDNNHENCDTSDEAEDQTAEVECVINDIVSAISPKQEKIGNTNQEMKKENENIALNGSASRQNGE